MPALPIIEHLDVFEDVLGRLFAGRVAPNEERPHDALAGLSPAMYRANLETRSSPLEVSP